MAKNGIIIDVGFKGDIKDFISSIENEFSKIDFSKYVNLEDSFEEQANNVKKELKKLQEEIESIVNKKSTTSLDTQVYNLNNAVNVLSNTIRNIYNKNDNIDKQYIKEIDNIINSTNELNGIVKNTTKSINEIAKIDSNIKIVDNSDIDYLKNTLKSLDLLSKKIQNIDKQTYKIGSNKSKYKDIDEVLPDISSYYRQYFDIQKQINSVVNDSSTTDEQKTKQLDFLNRKYTEYNVTLHQLINTYLNLDGAISDNINIGNKEIDVSSLLESLDNSFEKIQTWISNRKSDVISSLYDLGINNISDVIKDANNNIESTEKGIAIPLYVSTKESTLIKKTLAILEGVQNTVNDRPIECKVAFISSSYKSRKNQELLEQLQSEVNDLTDGQIKNDLQTLIEDITKEFNDVIKLKVGIDGSKDINRQLKALREAAEEELRSGDYTIYPDVQITDETKEKLQAELYALTNDVSIDLNIGGKEIDENGNIQSEINNIIKFKNILNEIIKVLEQKNKKFSEEENIVDNVVENEIKKLNELLNTLIDISSQTEKIINNIKEIPDNYINTQNIGKIENDEINLNNLDKAKDVLNDIRKIYHEISKNKKIDLLNINSKTTEQLNTLLLGLKTYINLIGRDNDIPSVNDLKNIIGDKNLSDKNANIILEKYKNEYEVNTINDSYSKFIDELKKTLLSILEKDDNLTKESQSLSLKNSSINRIKPSKQDNSYNTPESAMFFNENSGYYSDIITGNVAGISIKLIQNALNDIKENVDSFWHNHPDELTSAFSFDDIAELSNDIFKNIHYAIVSSLNDYSVLNISKLNQNQLLEISKIMDNEVNYHGNELPDGINKGIINDSKAIYTQLTENFDKTVDWLYSEISNIQIIDKNELIKKINSIDFSKSIDDIYDSIISIIDNYSPDISDKFINKSIADFQEQVLIKAINQILPNEKIENIYKKFSFKENNVETATSTLKNENNSETRNKKQINNNSNKKNYIVNSLGDIKKTLELIYKYNSSINSDERNEIGFYSNSKTGEASDLVIGNKNKISTKLWNSIYKPNEYDTKTHFHPWDNTAAPSDTDIISAINEWENGIKYQVIRTLNETATIDVSKIKDVDPKYFQAVWNSKFNEESYQKYILKCLEETFSEIGIAFKDVIKIEKNNKNIDYQDSTKKRTSKKNNYDNKDSESLNLSSRKEIIDNLKNNKDYESSIISAIKYISNSSINNNENEKPNNDLLNLISLVETINKNIETLIDNNNNVRNITEKNIPKEYEGININENDSSNTILNESTVLNNLLETIGLISNAIIEKTNNFTRESETVNNIIPQEIDLLDKLLQKLELINSTIENIVYLFEKITDKNIDIKISTDIQNNVGDLLNLMVNSIQELSKYLDTIKSIKNFNINNNVIKNLPDFSNAFKSLVNSLSSVPNDSINFIELLNNFANSSNLKDLATVLSASKNNVNNAKNVLKNNQSSIDNQSSNKKNKPPVQQTQHDVISTNSQISKDTDVSKRRKSYTYTDKLGTVVKVDFSWNQQKEDFDEVRTEVTNYNKIINQAVKATIDLQKAKDNLDEETRKGIPNQDLYNQYLKDELNAKNKLEQATRRANSLAKATINRVNDSHYSSKFTMDYFRNRVNEETLSPLSKQKERHLKNINVIDKRQINNSKQEANQNVRASKAYDTLTKSISEYNIIKDKKDKGVALTDKEASKYNKLTAQIERAINAQKEFEINKDSDFSSMAINSQNDFINNNIEYAKNGLFEKLNKEIKNTDSYSIQFINIIENIKKEISELNNSDGFYKISEDIEKAKEKAKNFKIVDNEEIYDRMGDISKTLYDSSGMSNKLKEQFKDLHDEYANLLDSKAPKKALDELNVKLSQLNEELHQSGYYGKDAFTKIKEKARDAGAQFISQYLSLRDFVRYIRQAIQAVVELDSALTEFKIVSNATDIQLKQISKSSYELANSLGSSTIEVLNSITSWRRLGKSIEESQILAEQSAILSTGGFMSVETSTTALTSSLQAFNMSVKDSSKLVDQFIFLGNNYAITSEELATSLEKSSAALVAAGNNVEQAQALEIAGNTILQDSDTVANALKVLSMRLRGTSASALEDVGEDTEGLIENASKLYETIKNLTKTQSNPKGVEIIDKETNAYKSTYDILLEISKVWDDINDTNKAALLEAIAGKTRGAAAAAILQNSEILESAYTDAMYNAEGAGTEALEASLDSIEKKVEIFQNKLQHFAQSLIDSGLIKWFVDAGNSILDFGDKIGSLRSLIGIGTFAFGINKNFNLENTPSYINSIKDLFKPNQKQLDYLKVGQFAKGQSNYSSIDMSAINKFIELFNSGKTESEAFAMSMSEANNETRDLASSITDVAGNALSEFTKGSKLASIATGLFSSGLLALGTMVLEWVISALIKHSKRLKESVDNLKQASEEQEKYNNTIVDATDKYNELYNKLQETNKGTNEYIQIQNDLLNVQNSLKESFEDEANNLDLVNGKYNEQIAILKEAQREKAKDYTLANEKDYENNIKYLDKNSNKTASNLAVASVSDNFQNLLKEYGVSIEEDPYGNNISTYSYDYDSVKDTYTNLKSLLKELKESDKFKNETSYKAIYDWIYNEYNSLDLTRIEDALSNIETYNKMMALGNASYSDSYQELQNKATEYNNALASHDQDRIATAKAEFDALVNDINIDGIEEEGIRDAFQAVIDSISENLLKSNDWYNRLNNSGKFTKGQFTEAEVKSALDSKNFLTGETGRKSLTDVGQLVFTSGINVDDEKEVNQFIAVLKDLGYIVDNFAETKVPKISTTLLNANEASEKLTSSLSSAYSAYETLLNPTANPQEMLDAISSINSAAKELNLEIDWEKIFSDGEFSTDELDLQLELIRNKTKEQLLDLFEFEDMPSGWETFIDGMVNSIVETQKATSEFNNLTNAIDRLQSSYSTLTDVMDTLNSGNGLSLDQLQSLISAEDNYIEMLTIENGQLTINQEKYKELIAEQLSSFRAKLDEAAAKEIDALANDNLAKSTAKASEEIVKNTGYLGKNTIAAYSNALAKGVDENSIKSVIQKYDAIWNAAVDKYNGDFTSFMNVNTDSSGEDKTQEYKELLDKQLEILQAQLDAGYIDFKDYIAKRRDLIEEYYAQNKISAEDYYSELNDLYEEQLSIYDRVIKAVEKQVDEQIDGYNKQKDAIDEEIEKLQDANDEREKAIDLQEKQYALARAENQRTRLVYRNGQLQYLSDPEEIRNARKDLADAELEKQVDALEKQKDSIDDLIQKAEEYKDKWSEISTILEEMQDKELADSILGDNWEDLVNALDPGIFENFKNGYLDLQRTIADNKIQLAEVEYQTQLDNISSSSGKSSGGYHIKDLDDDINLPTTNQKFSVYDTKSGELLGLFDDYIKAQKRVQELAKISGNNNYGIKGLSFDDNGFAESVETIDGHLKNWHLYIGDADAKAIELNKRFEEAQENVNNIDKLKDIEKNISKITDKKFTFNIEAKDNASDDISKISKEEIPDKLFGINANDKDASKKLSEIENVYIDNKDVLIKAIGEDNFYKVISSIEAVKLKDKIQYIYADASNADEKIKELSDYIFDVKKLLIETFGQEKANEIFNELEDGDLKKILDILTNSEDSETKLEKINELINNIPTSKSSNIDVTTTHTDIYKTVYEKEGSTPPYTSPNFRTAKASGTVSDGTAFAKGKDVTNGYDGTALVGELGAEMRIREGKFELIGKNGAEFTDVKKDDIIFNH